ncbi:hypothetical protein [Pseudarthrobacter sp. efr-133-R2A-89]|uniref:hypothetical protein n=1 Tax=Pseudarthrobacter sp. efr-133-R2A-89 TaxID=3040302 RepID=UPI0025529021|nr:hypothetical protein [Pseudarthrobacter sp. efr-133-R2A-89]
MIKGSIGSTAHAVLHHAKGPVLVSRRPPAAKAAHESQSGAEVGARSRNLDAGA